MTRLPWILALLLVLEASWFLHDQANGIAVTVQRLPAPRLQAVFDGTRVAQISDLHITRFGRREQRLVALLKKIDPDVLLVTGDLIEENRGIPACAQFFSAIAAGRQVIAVLGNNDHSWKKKRVDTAVLAARVEAAGVLVLRNQSARLRALGADGVARECVVTGLDDNFLWKDDVFRARRGVPAGLPVILLAHAPNIVEKITTAGIDAIVCGHTHGGQIALPGIGALYTNPVFKSRKRFSSGLYLEEVPVYVNAGIGTGSIPIRLFARPEVTVFRFGDS